MHRDSEDAGSQGVNMATSEPSMTRLGRKLMRSMNPRRSTADDVLSKNAGGSAPAMGSPGRRMSKPDLEASAPIAAQLKAHRAATHLGLATGTVPATSPPEAINRSLTWAVCQGGLGQ